MSAPLDVQSTEATSASPEAVLEGVTSSSIEGRSLSQIAWMRLKRDKVAIGGAVFILFLVVVAVFAPLIVKIPGVDPTTNYPGVLNNNLGGIPLKAHGGIDGKHWFGVEPSLGRDTFARIVYGARISLLIALFATMVSVTLGTVLGVTAGFFGGWIDNVISRVMDVLLAFPQLLFTIALISVVPNNLFGFGPTTTRLTVLVVVIGFFGWPYIGRIVRGQTLSLREREFVDAAKSIGASSGHILFRQLLPNLWAPIIVYASLIIPTNILSEAALSFLGVGVQAPTPSWGQMLSDASRYFEADPVYLAVPGLALFLTVLAFNLFGDGLRDALDPKSSR